MIAASVSRIVAAPSARTTSHENVATSFATRPVDGSVITRKSRSRKDTGWSCAIRATISPAASEDTATTPLRKNFGIGALILDMLLDIRANVDIRRSGTGGASSGTPSATGVPLPSAPAGVFGAGAGAFSLAFSSLRSRSRVISSERKPMEAVPAIISTSRQVGRAGRTGELARPKIPPDHELITCV